MSGRGRGVKVGKRRVTRDQIVELANQGFIRVDVADMLEISPTYLKKLIQEWGLADEFTVRGGASVTVTLKGYCR